jgi:hypothetical protein
MRFSQIFTRRRMRRLSFQIQLSSVAASTQERQLQASLLAVAISGPAG